MKLVKRPSDLSARVKGCARWLSKRVLSCAQPQVHSFGGLSISDRFDAPAPEAKQAKHGLATSDADDEWAYFDWALRSSCAEYYYHPHADGSEEADDNTSSAGPCTEVAVETDADAEVDAHLESIALACIDVPYLDPSSKQRPAGTTLLQHSPCSSAWVASLWAPAGTVTTSGSDGGGSWRQQRMLVKIHKFYSDEAAAAKAQAAVTRNGGGQQPKLYVPTERDAMHEIRMAVKLACASVRRIRGVSDGAASAGNPVPGGAGGSPAADGGRLGSGAQPLMPVHMEVRPCTAKRSKGGPDREVVVVYPYLPAPAAGEDLQADDPIVKPRGQQQRVRAWLHDSA